jgi:lysophospholipase L1-like esterase
MSWIKALWTVLFLFCLQSHGQEITIYTIGDSTMADKKNPDQNPEHGWAQVLAYFFTTEIQIDNRAVNGRSTKSFIAEGRWDSIVTKLQPNDYVFIQFGHNDQKFKDPDRFTNPYTAYRTNLIRFVEETRERGAQPILFTSIVRRNFNEFGVLIDTHGEYTLVVRMVANEFKVPLIDLQTLTEAWEISYGVEASKQLHLHFKPGEHPYYPNGKEDNTHLSAKGATEIAKMVVEAIEQQQIHLKKYIKK